MKVRAAIIVFATLPVAVYGATSNNSVAIKTATLVAQQSEKTLAQIATQPGNSVVYSGSWKGTNVGAGAVLNTGNSQSTAINGEANLKYVYKHWEYTGETTYQRNKSASAGVTANRLYLQGQAQYNLSINNYVYTQGNYTDDKFDGYKYTANWNIGYGANFHIHPDMTLTGFLGPGIQRRIVQSDNTTDNQFTMQLGARYTWQLNDAVQFGQDIQSNVTGENTRTTFNTSLTATLYSNLSFKVNYQAINDTEPQPNKSSWNTITTMNLVYNFA